MDFTLYKMYYYFCFDKKNNVIIIIFVFVDSTVCLLCVGADDVEATA